MDAKLTVLVVDDEHINRKLLKKLLEEEYTVLEAENGLRALSILRDVPGGVDAVLLDVMMPQMDGYGFLAAIRSTPLANLPVIVLTGEQDPESEKRALEAGAWDFVPKPYQRDVLRYRLNNVIQRSRVADFNRFRRQAEHDSLTGLYRRRRLFAEVRTLLDRNPDVRFLFVRFDINQFKMVNTFFGDGAGDRLLCHVADLLRAEAAARPLFVYGRMESDVFAFCMPFAGEEATGQFLQQLRAGMNRFGLAFDIVPSFGLYVVEDAHEDVNEICAKAILAVRRCKGNYMCDYAYYTADMQQQLMRTQSITNRMNAALENGEFLVYLQPKYDLQSNRVCGAEALARWQTPDGGLIAPSEFIPVFESNGFITKLDCYMWDCTCRMLRRWIDSGREPLPVSVNISRVSFYNPRIVETITQLAEKYALSPALLELELTESACTTNPQIIRDAMQQLRARGFTLLMDDFGSGYSSLNVLKNITVDVLKIDMQFMENADEPGRGQNILASVVRMAKRLHMPVVAEGVETQAQADFLRSIGCEFAQGFYYARPMPQAGYEALAFGAVPFFAAPPRPERPCMWESNSRLEMLFSGMTQAAAVLECDGTAVRPVRVNLAFCELFGAGGSGARDARVCAAGSAEPHAALQAACQLAVQRRGDAVCEYAHRLGSGRCLWLEAHVGYMCAAGGRHALLAMWEDVTARHALSEELQRCRTRLQSADGAEASAGAAHPENG